MGTNNHNNTVISLTNKNRQLLADRATELLETQQQFTLHELLRESGLVPDNELVETACGRSLAAFLPSIGLQRVKTDNGSYKKARVEYFDDGEFKKKQEILWSRSELPPASDDSILRDVDLKVTELCGHNYFVWSHINKVRTMPERNGVKVWIISEDEDWMNYMNSFKGQQL